MTVIDLYTGKSIGLGDSPSSESNNQDFNFWVSMEAGDVLEVCVGNNGGMTIQNTVIADISLDVSNYLCTINGQVTVGNNTIDAQVENSNTVWTAIGATTGVLNALDVNALQQIRLTANAATEVSMTVTDEAPVSIGFVSGGGGGGDISAFRTFFERQRIDIIPTGNIEYVELVEVDQSGNELVLTRNLADGTPYSPVGDTAFSNQVACCYCVDKIPPTFKANYGAATPVVNPIDGTFFFDDDTLAGAKGVILTIEDDLTVSDTITSIQWAVPAGQLGENSVNGAIGLNSARVFVRTHPDGTTPINTGNEVNCNITLANGVSIEPRAFFGVGFTTQRVIDDFTSNFIEVSQSSTSPTEVEFKLISYQLNTNEGVNTGDIVRNDNPISPPPGFGNLMILATPCGTYIDVSTFTDRPWNVIGANNGFAIPCDQSGLYSLQTVIPTGRLNPIGSHTPSVVMEVLVSLNTCITVFSYDRT